MPSYPLLRLRNPALLLALAAAFPAFSYAAGAARIDFSAGSVIAVSDSGTQRALSKGAEIGNGETIRTGDDARAQLRFSDGALVSLQPRTEFRIDNYQYAGQPDGKEQGFFSLLRGGLRTITGWVGRTHRDAYKVKTQVATIGIRGTGYKTLLDETGNELMISTSEGEVEVCNDAGCIVLASGESGVVQGANPPRRTGNQPLLSPTFLSQIPPLPGFSSDDARNSDGTYSALGGSQGSVPSSLSGTQTYATVYGLAQTYASATSDRVVGSGTLDSSGLVSFDDGMGTNTPGSGTVHNLGNDGLVAWGKWISGYFIPFGGTGTISGSEGILSYVTGVPTTDSLAALGGVSGLYVLQGGAVAGTSSGLGSITGGALNVDFTNHLVDLGLTASVGVNTYTLGAVGLGISGGSGSAVVFGGSGTTVGGSCSVSGCSTTFSGAFFGAGAPRAGVSFSFTDSEGIAGAAAFKKN